MLRLGVRTVSSFLLMSPSGIQAVGAANIALDLQRCIGLDLNNIKEIKIWKLNFEVAK